MRKYLFALVYLLAALGGMAKNEGVTRDSYNMRRGDEEAEKGNMETALEYYNKELEENPKNAFAHYLIACIEGDESNFGDSFSSIENALKLTPKKDKKLLAAIYLLRGQNYLDLGDSIKALDDFNLAALTDPANSNIYKNRGDLLFYLQRFDESDTDYLKLIDMNPGETYGYMGLGRNANKNGDYEKAITNYNKVLKIAPDYSAAYSFRAETYMNLKDYVKAADDVMKALSIDNDRKAYVQMFRFPQEQLPLVTAKLKAQGVSNPHDGLWQFYIGRLQAYWKNYKVAVDAFEKAFEIDSHPQILLDLSECYENNGQLEMALETIEKALQLSPSAQTDYGIQKAMLLEYLGNYDDAIAMWDEIINENPDYYFAYYRKGFVENNNCQYDESLADLEMCLMLEPEFFHALLTQADVLMIKGEKEKAMEAYRKVVELDSIPNENSCAMYALLALGRKDEAVSFMAKVIEVDTLNTGNYYDAACLYSRMGNMEESLSYLKKAIDKGFYKYALIMTDDDLIPLRETPEFKEFYEELSKRMELKEFSSRPVLVADSAFSEALPDVGKVEVPFTPDGGCASVKCTINDLPLTFIFDTGASIVSMSQLEANFMLKNGYLKRDDIVGTGRFVDANGDVSEGTIINLREVEFGGLKLTNVKASVVRNQKAPLLLGQSVLGRLGKIEIDNSNRKLIINP